MAAELRIEAGYGGEDGAPLLGTVQGIRLSRADTITIDHTSPIIQPGSEPVLTYERWVRLVCLEAPPSHLTNLRLIRSGPRPRGLVERWGMADAYLVPVDTQRVALTRVGDGPLIISQEQYGVGQVGPWLVFQWEITPLVSPGPLGPVTYRLAVDEY